MIDAPFIPGLQLSERFFYEAVQPILANAFPSLVYSAALIGSGSEVLGFDTPQSRDHNWGPRLQLFLNESELENLRNPISMAFSEQLPHVFLGYPTSFIVPSPSNGTHLFDFDNQGSVSHFIEITSLPDYFFQNLTWRPDQPLTMSAWLSFSEHRLLTLVSGKVFHDGLNQLEPIRQQLVYYPRNIWLYLLASQWQKIGQEEPFVGRCGDTGDDLGSRIIAGRLVQYLMRLCFLLERQYAPYSKWFGTAFSRLKCAGQYLPLFQEILTSSGWQGRQKALACAYELAASQQNRLGIIPPIKENAGWFYERPYQVIHADEIARMVQNEIGDLEIRKLILGGSVNQFIDSTDVLDQPNLTQLIAAAMVHYSTDLLEPEI